MFQTNITFYIYIILMLVSLAPIVGLKPFTFYISRRTTPKVVQTTSKFKTSNNLLSYFWAAIFGCAALLASLFEPSDIVMQNVVSAAFQLIIGVPVTIWSILNLNEYIEQKGEFKSCQDAFDLMPHGLCRRYAKAINANVVIQFELTGNENISGYLTIKEQKCTFHHGVTADRTVTIYSNSELWLKIINGQADASKEFIEGTIKTDGNASIMLHLNRLFKTGWNITLPTCSVSPTLYKEYRSNTPVKIKKCVIFYSGRRGAKISKTLFMANNLVKGIEDAGGEVETIFLDKMNITPCIGCYQCWTNTPGVCVFKDDMPELYKKYREADLVIFASPLYTFSVNGIMKAFMDRLIPNLLPYMTTNEDGDTLHPNRYPEKQSPHIMSVSAAGFPEIEGNFDGLRTMYKSWGAHMEGATMRGELLLPAAELLSIPVFEDRKTVVARNCYNIGKQLIENGCPSVDLMREISDTKLTHDEFAHMANIFWGNLDGKQNYTNYMNKNGKSLNK